MLKKQFVETGKRISQSDPHLPKKINEFRPLTKTADPKEPLCPVCKNMVWRDSVDVGVGIIHGPWGCGGCGWSSDPFYDCRSGPCEAEREDENKYKINQFGHLFKNKPLKNKEQKSEIENEF